MEKRERLFRALNPLTWMARSLEAITTEGALNFRSFASWNFGVRPSVVAKNSNQAIIVRMGANPEPDQALGAIPRQRTNVQANASGPEGPDLLES